MTQLKQQNFVFSQWGTLFDYQKASKNHNKVYHSSRNKNKQSSSGSYLEKRLKTPQNNLLLLPVPVP